MKTNDPARKQGLLYYALAGIALLLVGLSVGCGLAAQNRFATHILYPEGTAQPGAPATIVYDLFSRWDPFTNFKLVGIDGQTVEVSPDGSDQYLITPGLHTVQFAPSGPTPEIVTRASEMPIFAATVSFEALPGRRYGFFSESTSGCTTVAGRKRLSFFAFRQPKVRDLESKQTVSPPVPGEFEPVVEHDETTPPRPGENYSSMRVLNLYDGATRPDDQIARLTRGEFINVARIRGTCSDGSEIYFYGGFHFASEFVLLPGHYTAVLDYHETGFAKVTTSTGSLPVTFDILPGHSYVIRADVHGRTWSPKVDDTTQIK
jgi:hypothetical protein